ncbi:MAG: endonuclease/exonuclease/phosphatase family protein [Pseudomonadota bacterium]
MLVRVSAYFVSLAFVFASPAMADTIRFAQFNASMNRAEAGALAAALAAGDDPQILQVVAAIRAADPDVILINEFDYAPGNGALFNEMYLGGDYAHVFIAPSNTGVATGLDLNGDGEVGAASFALANDAFGFGTFPGQYGMVILSKFPLGAARTFQEFRWKDMPGARQPMNPDGTPYYSAEAWEIFRLSSKSHWAVPVEVAGRVIWALAAHPTPPVFDGPEDRNGTRNADEIRLIADIAAGADYVYDDAGVAGGLPEGASFVIMGDMNSDPFDGDSLPGATDPLLAAGLTNVSVTPEGPGGLAAAADGVNPAHKGNPADDTAAFNPDGPGNLRVDYVLPSADLEIAGAAVLWPEAAEWLAASDHRLVWVDIALD